MKRYLVLLPILITLAGLAVLFCLPARGTQSAQAATAPRIEVSPEALVVAQTVGQVTAHTLTVSNLGGEALDFDLAGREIVDDFSADSGLWTYLASAYRDPANEYVILTEPEEDAVGTMWLDLPTPVPFTAEFRYRAGEGTSGGADGLVFMFYKDKDYVPAGGGCLGFGEFPDCVEPGYGIEFDGWWNAPDPYQQHVAIIKDSPLVHLQIFLSDKVGDYLWHCVRVEFGQATIKVFLDEELVLNREGELDRSYSGLGLSGATGAQWSWHQIDDFHLIYTEGQAEWLTVAPISGTVSAGSSIHVQLTFNSNDLQPGIFTTTLYVLNNDPLNRLVTIPLKMSVGTPVYLPTLQTEQQVGTGILVTTLEDELNRDGDCSLREAVTAANTNAAVDDCPGGAVGTDTITFAVAGTIPVTRELAVTAGGWLVIDGGEVITTSGGGTNRVWWVETGSNLTLQNLDVIGGDAPAGGGLYNNGSVTLSNSTFSGNQASGCAPEGGGIFNRGTLFITHSTFTGNIAMISSNDPPSCDSAHGGGVYNQGNLRIILSTFTGNKALNYIVEPSPPRSVYGGGIFNKGALAISNSTFTDNEAASSCMNSGSCQGSAAANGGGIDNRTALHIRNSTFSGNAALGRNGDSLGGGIRNRGYAAIANTIVANNIGGGDCNGEITDNGHNLDSDGTCDLRPGQGSRPNTDPRLAPLQDNGGPTWTQALLPGSPAIDAGNNDRCPSTDQRGVSRPLDGNLSGRAVCDMGAYEYQPAPGPAYLRIVSDDTWRVSGIYLPGWETLDFDDSDWEYAAAPAPVNCGWEHCWDDPDVYTMWSEIQYQTIYIRKVFYIPDNSPVLSATITTRCDDDHDLYINGTLVATDWDGVAGPILVTDITAHLHSGANVIAVKASDTAGGCRHMCVDTGIHLEYKTPGWIIVEPGLLPYQPLDIDPHYVWR